MSAHPNVVLIVADALRADSLGPLVRARFDSWHRFQQCFGAAPWTLPSCTSLMTGTDTRGHGHFTHQHQLTRPTLTAQFGPERLKAALVNNSVLGRSSGLASGFDEYKFVPKHTETFEAAHRFLDDRDADDRPFFLLVHSNIPHDYFLPISEPYYERAFPDRKDWFALRYKVISWRDVNPEQRETVRRVYDACALALDEQLDRLIGRLDPDATTICFTADHGEGFDVQHGRVHHGGRVHDDVIRVPCAIHVPPSAPAAVHEGLRAAQNLPVTPPDILPTLLAIAECGTEAAHGGADEDRATGRNLVEVGAANERRMLFSEDRRYLYLANRRRMNTNAKGKHMTKRDKALNRVLRSTIAEHHALHAFIDPPYKLIVTSVRARNVALSILGGPLARRLHNGNPYMSRHGSGAFALELFDLESDPTESTNLLLGKPELVEAVEPLLRAPSIDASRGLYLRELVA